MGYDIHCEFDIEAHKKKYIDYFEVLILENGKIEYAVPSHQIKAERICCEKLGVDGNALSEMCPKEMWGDYLTWLLNICGAVCVWEKFYLCGSNGLTIKQRFKLKQLKLNGLYKGKIV